MRHRHWRRVGSQTAARTNRETRQSSWLLLLFLSSPAVRITVTCNKRKTHKQQLILSFPPCFQICFSPFSFFIFASFSLQIPFCSLCFKWSAVGPRDCWRMGFCRVCAAASSWFGSWQCRGPAGC